MAVQRLLYSQQTCIISCGGYLKDTNPGGNPDYSWQINDDLVHNSTKNILGYAKHAHDETIKDLDGDGVSNLNDLWPFDPSQSLDTDGDSYGDNPEGIDGDACPEVPGVSNGDGGDGCPPVDTDGDNDGVDDIDDQCQDTPEGTVVGIDGCETEDEQTNPNDNTTTDDNVTLGDNVTGDGNDDTPPNGDDDEAADDGTQSSSELFGMDTITLGILAGAILILLLSLVLIVRGRSSSDEDKLFEQQQMAYASITELPSAADPTVTPEQLAYEQQLIAAGYPASYARTYADQHFRPWLNL